jgi:hypothetical protein
MLLINIGSFNLRSFIDTEIQGFQKRYTTFSSAIQLFDQGNMITFRDVQISDFKNFLKNVFNVIKDGDHLAGNTNFKNIELFIKFNELQKIYKDQEKALKTGINNNAKWVKCLVSDGFNKYKCKVRLKGDLRDHWNALPRMSLKIKIQNGYVHGLSNFSIQKPRARSFPYDQVFHAINNEIGGLSSDTKSFAHVTINGESVGAMVIEPTIDDKYIESIGLKRSGVYRISDQEIWKHEMLKNSYNEYFLSDPTITFSREGKKKQIIKNELNREIYSYIGNELNKKNFELFDRQKMISAMILAFVWGSNHTLFNQNSWYTWNNYTHKLEPILTDQAIWRPLILDEALNLPYEYRLVFTNNPITIIEFNKTLNKIENILDKESSVKRANLLKKKFFPNDQLFDLSPLKINIKKLRSRSINWIERVNSSVMKKTKINSQELSSDLTKNIKKFIEVVHFTDGVVKIFNLLDKPVRINSIYLNEEKILVNKLLDGSKKESLSSLEIKTPFHGTHDFDLTVTSKANNLERSSRNQFSRFPTKYFKKQDNQKYKIYCNNDDKHIKCIISGNKTITKSTTFNVPVIIKAGTTIYLEKSADLIFSQSVKMLGKNSRRIKFLSKGSGLVILNSRSNVSVLNHVTFSGMAKPTVSLRKYTGSINGYGGNFYINDVISIDAEAEDHINLVNCKIEINNITIINAQSDGLDCDICRGKIKNVFTHNISGDALDFSGSQIILENLRLNATLDKAISVGERTSITANNIFIKSAGTAIAVKDSSSAEIKNIRLEEIKHDAFMTYVKKPFFTGRTILYASNVSLKSHNVKKVCVRQEGTVAYLNGNPCKVSNVNTKKLYLGRMKK